VIVVADTSPLLALSKVGQTEILRQLFGHVIIPPAVQVELVRCIPELPDWVRVEPVKNAEEARRMAQWVDWGEAEAIELAKELGADRLLIDERKGRKLAMVEGVQVIGVLGVLLLAKKKGLLLSLRELMEELKKEAGFYLAEALVAEVLEAAGEVEKEKR
jgi:predicted nucleic acid-binding protein